MRPKVIIGMLANLLSLAVLAGTVTATGVTARQRFPWNGLVDIAVTMRGEAADVNASECFFAAADCATGRSLPIVHLKLNGVDSGSGTTWVRKFVWDAARDIGEVRIEDVELVADVDVGVQLWAGGPYWSRCNVGASKPEETGYYFWWGDTVGYRRDGGTIDEHGYCNGVTWVSSKGMRMEASPFIASVCPTCGKDGSQLRSAGYVDSNGGLSVKYDAATAHWGDGWRMPTDADFSSLMKNCDTIWTTIDGVYGRFFRGRGSFASKSIFLPAAGFCYESIGDYRGLHGLYWTSTPSSETDEARNHYFDSRAFYQCNGDRSCGQPVRPVRVLTFPVITDFTAADRGRNDGKVDLYLTIAACVWPTNTVTLSFAAKYAFGGVDIPMRALSYGTGSSETISSAGTYHVVWDALADLGRIALSNILMKATLTEVGTVHTVSRETSAVVNTCGDYVESDCVQLWEGGPHWAECNVGATRPEESGYYFWWGDTVGYKRDPADNGWVSVGDGTAFGFSSGNCRPCGMNKSQLQSAGYIDSAGNLAREHDAATVHWGPGWRMPTAADWRALIDNCTISKTSRNGVNGRLVCGKGAYASRSIFLPAAGNGNDFYLDGSGSYGGYWSSTPDSDFSDIAVTLGFNSGTVGRSGHYRYCGQPVRPLR